MACKRYQGALSDLAAGGPAKAEVEAHLQSCEACRAELLALRQALTAVDEELARLRLAEPSSDFAARIRKAVAESGAAEPGCRLGWGLMVAAAVVVIVAALIVGRRGSQPVPGTPAEPATQTTEAHREPPREALRATPVPKPETVAASLPSASQRGRAERDRTEPEVLVPAGQAEALIRFAASLQRRAVTSDSLLVADLSAPLPEPKDVFIQPLEIVPLDPDETSGAE